jgi:hypothetical protein
MNHFSAFCIFKMWEEVVEIAYSRWSLVFGIWLKCKEKNMGIIAREEMQRCGKKCGCKERRVRV